MIPKLTERQQQIYDYLVSFTRKNGIKPSTTEIAQAFGFRSVTAVRDHLVALERKGYIKWGFNRARDIQLVNLPLLPDVVHVPVVGHVQAGPLSEAVQNAEETLTLDRSLVPHDGCWALRVQGSSMIRANIVEGDVIILSPQATAENGQTVVALVGSEATVKKIQKTRGKILLKPENEQMKPITLTAKDENVRILGRVVGLVRRYK